MFVVISFMYAVAVESVAGMPESGTEMRPRSLETFESKDRNFRMFGHHFEARSSHNNLCGLSVDGLELDVTISALASVCQQYEGVKSSTRLSTSAHRYPEDLTSHLAKDLYTILTTSESEIWSATN